MPYSPGLFSGPFDRTVFLKLLLVVFVVWALLNYLPTYPALFTGTLVVIAALAALVVAHVLVTVLRVQYASRWGPTRSVMATVTRKWTDEQDYGLPLGGPVEGAVLGAPDQDAVQSVYESWNFWVAFDLGEGDEEEFRVRESVYAAVEEGMAGVLTYRGERLLSFLPSEEPPPDGEGGGGGETDRDPSQRHPGPHVPRG